MSSSYSWGRPESAASPRGERLAQHSAVLEQAALLRQEAVQAGGDQGVQGLGDLERLDLARGPVDGAVLGEEAPV
jgi:hypothetical protein